MPFHLPAVALVALAAKLLTSGPAIGAEPSFWLSPLVAKTGVATWSSSCSQTLGYCEIDNDQISLRRASAPGSDWVVSVRPGRAPTVPRVEEVRFRPNCACDKVVLVPGKDLKVLGRPDEFAVVDTAKATALIDMLLAANGEKITRQSFHRGWSEDNVNTKGFAAALDWVDQQQGRSDRARTAAAPTDSSEISAKIIADAERFTDPERTLKDLPRPVQALHAKALRSGCKLQRGSREHLFQTTWLDRQHVVFFVMCTRPDISPLYRVYAATASGYQDARAVELVQWTEATLKGEKARARRSMPAMPMFGPTNTLVLHAHRDGINSCRIEHSYRWVDGDYRLLSVRASECTLAGSGPEAPRTVRFRASAER
jgi:Protein of unknown function (DUF1176)